MAFIDAVREASGWLAGERKQAIALALKSWLMGDG